MKVARAVPFGPEDEWLTPGLFALVLSILIFVAFPQVLLGVETFIIRDYGFFAYPLASFQRDCFWHGELPFWNPYNNCGVPFLAQLNTISLYPPSLIYLTLPLGWSLSFFCLLHLFWAGLGMYFLAHRWSGSHLAAAVAGVGFAFSGLSLNLLMWPSHIATYSWMPWVVLTVETAWRKGGMDVIRAGFAGALQMLAGGPETILFTWVLLAAIWIVEHFRGPEQASASLNQVPGRTADLRQSPAVMRRRAAARFATVVVLVACLSAIQLLPFLDLAAHSQRDRNYSDARWSMPARGWGSFFVPLVFGRVGEGGVFFQHEQFWTSSYYLGIIMLLLAMLAIWINRSRRVWLLSAASVLAFVLAQGPRTFLYQWLVQLIPILGPMTYPVKYVLVIAFAVPLLAAFAVARIRRIPEGQSRATLKRLIILGSLFVGVIAAVLGWAWLRPFHFDDPSAETRNGLGRVLALALTLAVLIALVRSRSVRQFRVLSLGLLLALWLDVWTHAPNQNPTVTPQVYEPGAIRAELKMQPQPALGQTRVMLSPMAEETFNHLPSENVKDAYLARRLGYFSDCNLLDEVPKVNGFFSLYPGHCYIVSSLLYFATNSSFPRLADFLAVSHITAPGEFTQWEPRNTYLPMVTAGQKPVFLDDTNTVRQMLGPNFDGSKMVYLPPETQTRVTVSKATGARVLWSRFGRARVEAEAEAKEASMVVFSQSYYHCWRAYIDEQPTVLLRANYAFQAVQIPPGRHHIRLVYEDRAFQAGAALSGLGLLGCLSAWFILRRREKLHNGGGS
jgi:hypothetical protein